MIVTIDGPAGAGKSSVARLLAHRLGFEFLDTGAMYRAVTWAAVDAQLDWADPQALVDLAGRIDIQLPGDQVLVNGRDVSKLIRSSEITGLIHYAANNPGVRAILVDLQRRVARRRNMVTEGRDQGTVVFPDAECKLFLTASPEERARRRLRDLQASRDPITFDELLHQQNERDARDARRSVGPLRAAEDAIEVCTDNLSRDEVVERVEQIVRQRLASRDQRQTPSESSSDPRGAATADSPLRAAPRIGPLLGAIVCFLCLDPCFAPSSRDCLAQPASASATPTASAELIERQRQVEQRYQALLFKYQQLAQSLESKEPEQAQRIAKTLDRAKELLFEKRLASVSSQLRAGQLPAAIDEQQQILADLQRLLRTLQTGEDSDTETMDVSGELERRLSEVLARQQPVTAATTELAARQPTDGNWRRADRLLLARQAEEQRQLSKIVEESLELIETAESADVVRSLLGSVRADMDLAAAALADRRLQNDVLSAQSAAEATLTDLIRSLARPRPRSGERGEQPAAGAGEPGAPPPLVPPAAVLKLLRATQDRLEQRTSALDARRAQAGQLSDSDRRELTELARRQEEIEKLVEAMLP